MASQKHNLVIKNRPSSETSKLDPQEQYLPIANVSRIMKKSLPENAKISKEAKETVQECVSEFISFITGEASDKCLREKRKTINGEDLLWSMATLGFESYVGTLKVYLNKHKQNEGDHHEDANMARQEYANLDSLHTDAAEKVKVDHSVRGLDNDGYYGDDEVGVEVISSKRLKGVNNLNFDLGNNYGGDIFNPAEFAGRTI